MSFTSFFILSGDSPDIGYAELRAIHRVYGDYILEWMDRRMVLSNTNPEVIGSIVKRSAYTKIGGILLSLGYTNRIEEIVDGIDFERLKELVGEKKTYRVRVLKLEGVGIDAIELEKRIAVAVKREVGDRLILNLSNPQVILLVVVSPLNYIVGVVAEWRLKSEFEARKPGKRPFALPSALQPKIARCMVNLAVRGLDARVLDPFAGTGSIVIEAALLGHTTVGVEIKDWICSGCWRNVVSVASGDAMIINGDARYPPLRRVFDAVVTDPPYGRSSTIPSKSFNMLMEDFFSKLPEILRCDGLVCMAYPHEYYVEEIAARSGYRLVEKHSLYVHKSLTRNIAVFSHDGA